MRPSTKTKCSVTISNRIAALDSEVYLPDELSGSMTLRPKIGMCNTRPVCITLEKPQRKHEAI